jgi:hypothetical protein
VGAGGELDVVVARRVVDADRGGGLAGLLERLGHHGGDDLPAVVDGVGLEEQELAIVGLAEAGRVVVRDHREHAGEAERGGGVDGVDLAGGDGGDDGRGVGDALDRLLERRSGPGR